MKVRHIITAVAAVVIGLVAVGCNNADLSGPGNRSASSVVGIDALSALSVLGVNGEIGFYCTELFAGQTINAGSVCVEVIDNGASEQLCFTYTTSDGWELVETHLWVGEALADMPQTRKGSPKVGNFPYHSGDITGATEYTVCIDLAEFGGEAGLCAEELLAAAHAVVRKDNGDGTYQTETGWGDGDRMLERGNWATFFSIQFNCGGGENPNASSETAFAYNCDDAARTCFIGMDDGDGGTFNRWGWTNGPLAAGTYYFDIYAGAGRCDITKGTLVGLLTVDYDGATATVTYNTCGDYTMTETHLYVGSEALARNVNNESTVAPGQYPYKHDGLADVQEDSYVVDGLSGDIYVVAHAVVWGDYAVSGDCGERGCVPPCVPGFDYDEHQAQIDAANNVPGEMKIQVQYPYGGAQAYFPTTLIDYDGDGVAEVTTQSWCVDLDHTIGQNTWYCAIAYSSFADLTGLDDTRWENLDVVNWILNQGFVGTSSPGGFGTYTYGDIQRSIWSLVEPGGQQSTSGLGSWDGNRVAEILAAATAAVPLDNTSVDYEPPCDGIAGVILKPVQCAGAEQQILIAQVLVSEYPSVCTVCP